MSFTELVVVLSVVFEMSAVLFLKASSFLCEGSVLFSLGFECPAAPSSRSFFFGFSVLLVLFVGGFDLGVVF